MATTSA